MVSVIMQETAKYGVGNTFRRHKLTKEDIESADRMEREIIRKQHAVKARD